MNEDCTRSHERCKIGKWIVDEVRKAVDIGYGVVDVHELWDYKVTCFDRQ